MQCTNFESVTLHCSLFISKIEFVHVLEEGTVENI